MPLWTLLLCTEVDLALLSVDDEESLEGIQPLELATADALPLVFDKALVAQHNSEEPH